MDSIFRPRTFSTDWEVMVLDRLNRRLDTQQCDAFAGALQAELDLPVHVDWDTIEFGLGVNTSYGQFRDPIRRLTDRASEMVHEYELDLFPAAASPLDDIFNAAHVHVGSLFDEEAGLHLANQLLPFVPAFGALAANSPFSEGRTGAYKSYRVRHLAHGCTCPGSVRSPATAQATWGDDAAPKLYGYPTLEVRIIDCASSRQFLAELATFVAAFVHQQGTDVSSTPPTRQQYRECMTNRWAAAKHGLQATFHRDGRPLPVVDVLDDMLDSCADALTALGATRADFTLINTMLRKRVCQADFALGLAERYADPYLLISAYAKLVRHWDVFDDFVARCDVLDTVAPPDEDVILAEHLEAIGEGTRSYRLREVMYLPAPEADALLETMMSRGWIRRELTTERGLLLHRVV